MAAMRPKVAEAETLTGDLADLRAFCLAVDLGSVTAAARALDESKGALSRRIARLERSVGATLLRRGPRSVSATEEGALFRARAGVALESLDEAAAEVRAGADEPRGTLRVTGPTDLGVLLAPVIAQFAEAHPALRVEVELTQATLDFEAHRIDVAFRAAAVLRDSPLVAHRLRSLSLGLFATPGYLRQHGAPQHPGELAAHRVFAMRPHNRPMRLTLRAGDTAEVVQLRPVVQANDNVFVRDATLSGAALGVLIAEIAAADVAAGRLVPVLEAWSPVERGAIFLLHENTSRLPAKVRAFREHARRALGDRSPLAELT